MRDRPMDWLRRLLFPEPARELRHQRACNIAFRTVHIAATGILLGGHVFDVEQSRLRGSLYLRSLARITYPIYCLGRIE